MISQTGVDVIVRFHSLDRIMELERCVFSLISQKYRPLRIILTLQRFNDYEIEKVQQALEPLLRSPLSPEFKILNWHEPEPVDARSCLLNMGIEVASGRYLAFLDYDDLLYPEAYELMVRQLFKTDSAICFASVHLLKIQPYRHFIYTQGEVDPPPFSGKSLLDLFRNNFCPLHSYVIDRSRVAASDLYFERDMTIEEDYDLLLRLCAQYRSDFELLPTSIGTYSYKTDGSNTVAAPLDGEKKRLYRKTCSHIEELRKSTFVSEHVKQQLGFSRPLTI